MGSLGEVHASAKSPYLAVGIHGRTAAHSMLAEALHTHASLAAEAVQAATPGQLTQPAVYSSGTSSELPGSNAGMWHSNRVQPKAGGIATPSSSARGILLKIARYSRRVRLRVPYAANRAVRPGMHRRVDACVPQQIARHRSAEVPRTAPHAVPVAHVWPDALGDSPRGEFARQHRVPPRLVALAWAKEIVRPDDGDARVVHLGFDVIVPIRQSAVATEIDQCDRVAAERGEPWRAPAIRCLFEPCVRT
eukprot:2207473-Prymnesium_polylepis.2